VQVRPNPRVSGYVPATVGAATKFAGDGKGVTAVEVVNSELVPDGHLFKVSFTTPSPESLRATAYTLSDSTTGDVLFETGHDFDGKGIGPVGSGLLPVVYTQQHVEVDTAATGFTSGSPTDARLRVDFLNVHPINQRRPGFPSDVTIRFYDVVVDTSVVFGVGFQTPRPRMKFEAIAHELSGDVRMKCRFRAST
jgi:hypothetical protein